MRARSSNRRPVDFWLPFPIHIHDHLPPDRPSQASPAALGESDSSVHQKFQITCRCIEKLNCSELILASASIISPIGGGFEGDDTLTSFRLVLASPRVGLR
jgi:hypothetical protein